MSLFLLALQDSQVPTEQRETLVLPDGTFQAYQETGEALASQDPQEEWDPQDPPVGQDVMDYLACLV